MITFDWKIKVFYKFKTTHMINKTLIVFYRLALLLVSDQFKINFHFQKSNT